ncbi:glycosyltransferase family 39 protein [Candidatus Woesearchaeota archaeon]|nr:glycosyltransferase family 39 protein [Candidatus Woesearchaeota archaeon]
MNIIKNFREQDFISKLTISIIIFAVILRFAIASYTIEGGDPCYHASAASFLAKNLRFPLFDYIGREIFAHEPLFHVAGAVLYNLFGIFGKGSLGIGMVSPLFGSGMVVLAFLISRRLFDKYTALLAVIFTSFLPLSTYHSTTAHIDMAGAFFALLSFYLLLIGRFYFSSIAFGLSLLGRINSLFMAPALAYLIFRKYRKNFFGKFLVFFMIGFLVASPWYARNYTLLHNPVWPFLNSFFGGYYKSAHDFKPDKLAYMLNVQDAYIEVHLALFGVPDGKYENLFLFRNNLFSTGIALWVVFTIISLVPLLFIFKKKCFRNKNFRLALWVVLPYLFFLYFYQFNYGNTSTRYMLTAVPFLGILWAFGIKRLLKLNKTIAVAFLVLFIFVFSVSEAVKSAVITHQWKNLDKDFEWVEENTGKNALFIVPGQCLGYRIGRQSFPARGTGYNLVPSLEPPMEKIGYILDINSKVHSPIKKDAMAYYLPYFQKVYENNETNVVIYKRK